MQTLIYNKLGSTGENISQEFIVPSNFVKGEITAMVSSPKSELNIFDIVGILEVQDEQGNWRQKHSFVDHRDIDIGTKDPVLIEWAAFINDLAGKKVRFIFRSGQSSMNVSIVINH